ncbi:hypothetical protein Bca4012_077334 [Brassica carinata]|uniref:Transmembrane protein n=3 Tax=Brassica TaxID=3705 RepID=A0A8X7U476_BRACI|nr:uncharacterized protein BNAC07G14170D [Brassica napus]XP_013721818.1 uncharacterized protein BNAC07G14170D [Brassica napus]KAG2265307.1 hypothetical protein Bca52824_072386 [Brassica carinata]VDD37153.1 unnamed protein product [Brassica oleracea]KAH0868658.1 hypothetical protein HID58_075680 [Brassica napus]CAF1979944.1 unnamed protein product [Brassica napus]
MGTQENVKHLEECTVSNALGTWVFSVLGALVAIPVGIKRKSLGPLVFFGTTGTMLDIIIGVTQCEREHAEHQLKLLQDSQNATTNNAETDSLS